MKKWYLDIRRWIWFRRYFEMSCDPISGYSSLSGDCNDLDSFTNPSALDECDNFDNDCDGIIDKVKILYFFGFEMMTEMDLVMRMSTSILVTNPYFMFLTIQIAMTAIITSIPIL